MIQYLSSRTHIPRVTFNCTFKHEKKSTGSDRRGAFSNGSVSFVHVIHRTKCAPLLYTLLANLNMCI